MGREEVIERAEEGERILGKREEDKRKERGERERMDGRTDGWTGVVLLCLRVLLLGLCRLVWSFLNLCNEKDKPIRFKQDCLCTNQNLSLQIEEVRFRKFSLV